MRSYLPHKHENWEIVLNLRGTVAFTLAGEEYQYQEGDCLLIPPNTVHSGFASSEEGLEDICFQCSECDPDGFSIVHDYDGSIKMLIELLVKTYIEKSTDYIRISGCLGDTILAILNRNMKQRDMYRCRKETMMFADEIYRHLSDAGFRLNDAARTFGFSADHLRRMFIRDFQQTPHEYLINMRLEQACSYLSCQPELGISQIALYCGFTDRYHFSKSFKSKYGLTPYAYRIQQKRKNENESM